MNDKNETGVLLKNNPVFVIGVAIAIAFVMILVGFLLYYGSPTRLTVEKLQQNKRDVNSSSVILTTSGPLSTTDIESITQTIEVDVSKLKDEVDYDAAQLTDSSLGL